MEEFRADRFGIIKNPRAAAIYEAVKELPIIDYHCHLSPKEIYEDKSFLSIGDMWLAADHYKWRLMRCYGVEERFITGNAPMKEKFDKFAEAVATAFGNPVRDWIKLELEKYFGITEPLNPHTADYIWNKANEVIKDKKLSPRKLIAVSNVEYIATTDDVCDDLEYHKLLAEDKTFSAKVAPSFRTDALFDFDNSKYPEYIQKLSEISGYNVVNLKMLKAAVSNRLDFFVKMSCKFSDVGLERFPNSIASDDEADQYFKNILSGKGAEEKDKLALLGNMYVFLAKEYRTRGIVMQLHLGAGRNANSEALKTLGRDTGFDYVGDYIPVSSVRKILDAVNNSGGIPKTILYSLDPDAYYRFITLCGSFRGAGIGISWWFCDHKEGMTTTFKTLSELGHINSLSGMLTDSRSFLSYVRHDYFRKILAAYIADVTTDEELEDAVKVANNLCYFNAKKIVG